MKTIKNKLIALILFAFGIISARYNNSDLIVSLLRFSFFAVPGAFVFFLKQSLFINDHATHEVKRRCKE